MTKSSLNITYVNFHYHFPGAKELKQFREFMANAMESLRWDNCQSYRKCITQFRLLKYGSI